MSFFMSPNTMGIGEPEGSQDTPLRNTTPSKRLRFSSTTLKPKKRQKMNQCQLAFHVILMRDVTVDILDASYKSIDKELEESLETRRG